MLIALRAIETDHFVNQKGIDQHSHYPIPDPEYLIGRDGFESLINIKLQYEKETGENEYVFLHNM